ncbi:HNH endonuclease family protein [Pseudonocardia sichuanensis]
MRIRHGLLAVALLLAACGTPSAAAGAVLAEPARGIPPYEREAFGDGWSDLDRDCQDTRQEILIRDLEPEQLDADGCRVLTGTLDDSYTGTVIEFRRGQGTSDDVQIDHVIPLSYAWRAGAYSWTPEQREAFANDGAELRAVDGPTNNRKGDRGPSRWLPPNTGAHCSYAAAWRDLAATYALALDDADAATVEQLLGGCPAL